MELGIKESSASSESTVILIKDNTVRFIRGVVRL
jgi:hypothetical protein